MVLSGNIDTTAWLEYNCAEVNEMADKIFSYEYHPGEELVLRFRFSGTADLYSMIGTCTRMAVKEGLIMARGLIDVIIGLMEQSEENVAKKTSSTNKPEQASDAEK